MVYIFFIILKRFLNASIITKVIIRLFNLIQGSTRAFPPHHPLIPVDYQLTGQPVLIGGTMGTCSYVLTGTHQGMTETYGSTCHGAVSIHHFYILVDVPSLLNRRIIFFLINWKLFIVGIFFSLVQYPNNMCLCFIDHITSHIFVTGSSAFTREVAKKHRL